MDCDSIVSPRSSGDDPADGRGRSSPMRVPTTAESDDDVHRRAAPDAVPARQLRVRARALERRRRACRAAERLGLRRGPLADAHRRRSPKSAASSSTMRGRDCPPGRRRTTAGSRLNPNPPRLASTKINTRCTCNRFSSTGREVRPHADDCRFWLTPAADPLLESLETDEEAVERGAFT